jgi:hypothetical protein
MIENIIIALIIAIIIVWRGLQSLSKKLGDPKITKEPKKLQRPRESLNPEKAPKIIHHIGRQNVLA